MDLLEQIDNCPNDELKTVVTEALKNSIASAKAEERLGFPDNGLATAKIPSHRGFISPKSRIKYSNGSTYMYSMKNIDYIVDFIKYVKNNNIKDKGTLVKHIENFINNYFGISNGVDKRDAYFDQEVFQTTQTDEEYFEKIENLQIGDLKGKNVAMCTERAALAQNILAFFGFDTYYCMGCINNNGKEEAHCFNVVRAKNSYLLLDYSIPVPVFENGKAVDYAPFQGKIDVNELENVLENGLNKEFPSYEYIKNGNNIQRVDINQLRTYQVGYLKFEHSNSMGK